MLISRMFGSLAPYWHVLFHEGDSGVGNGYLVVSGMQMLKLELNCIPVPVTHFLPFFHSRRPADPSQRVRESLISKRPLWFVGATILGGKEE